MADGKLTIDGIEFHISKGNPFQFEGIHSGRSLFGLNLRFAVYSEDELCQIDALLDKKAVQVEDPFADSAYKAVLKLKSSMHQEGVPGKRYHLEIKELDEAITFNLLEIEGQSFPVIRNTESLSDGVVGIHALLRLSPDDFRRFHSLLDLDSIAIQRIGVDDRPTTRRFGGALYWSSHEEENQEFYKQIVRFYPPDDSRKMINLASGYEQRAHSLMILELFARYEALVSTLIKNGHIDRDYGERLVSGEWREMIGEERKHMMRSRLWKIEDAELELE